MCFPARIHLVAKDSQGHVTTSRLAVDTRCRQVDGECLAREKQLAIRSERSLVGLCRDIGDQLGACVLLSQAKLEENLPPVKRLRAFKMKSCAALGVGCQLLVYNYILMDARHYDWRHGDRCPMGVSRKKVNPNPIST